MTFMHKIKLNTENADKNNSSSYEIEYINILTNDWNVKRGDNVGFLEHNIILYLDILIQS